MLDLEDLILRPMEAGDLADVLAWRNAENVRRNMLNDKFISMAEHQAWFKDRQADPGCEWLVAELSATPVGVVGITDIDPSDGTATWSMYLSESVKTPGVGALMEYQVIERLFGKHNIRKIWGETLSSNRSTLALHRRFGFTQEGVLCRQVRRGDQYEDVVRVALFAEDWKRHKNKLRAMLTPKSRSQSGSDTAA